MIIHCLTHNRAGCAYSASTASLTPSHPTAYLLLLSPLQSHPIHLLLSSPSDPPLNHSREEETMWKIETWGEGGRKKVRACWVLDLVYTGILATGLAAQLQSPNVGNLQSHNIVSTRALLQYSAPVAKISVDTTSTGIGVCACEAWRKRASTSFSERRMVISFSLPLLLWIWLCMGEVWWRNGGLSRRSGEDRVGCEHVTGLVGEVLNVYVLSSRLL